MREIVTLVSGVTVSPDVPGYLELSPDRLERIVVREPIDKFYDVEQEPFARGKSAAVRRCVERASGRHYAAKFLKKRRRSHDMRAETLHEVAVLEACRGCHRVVSLHQVFESPTETVLILELARGGELQTLLDSDEVPGEGQVVRLMRQILDGIVYLHTINVAHLDLKPQNLVLTGEYPSCDVKLCDFGISRYLSQGADVREILGTPDYVAPEVLNYEPISLATDMWSVGVLMYVLLTGCSPFGGDTKQETFCNITQCRLDFPEELFEDISTEAQDLMTKLMVTKPSERLCAKECLEHPWFSKDFLSLPTTPLQRTPVATRRHPEPTATTETLLPTGGLEENDNAPPAYREKPTEKLDNERAGEGKGKASRNAQTVPVARMANINTQPPDRETLFKFKQIYITDDGCEDSLPADAAFGSDTNSDTVSDMSIDSSSDRSSVISLDDSLDYGKAPRYYSSCLNVWEAARGQQRGGACNGAYARARSVFLRDGKLSVFDRMAVETRRDHGSDRVTIKEVKPVRGKRYVRTSEVTCETVSSRIKKLEVYSDKISASATASVKEFKCDVF